MKAFRNLMVIVIIMVMAGMGCIANQAYLDNAAEGCDGSDIISQTLPPGTDLTTQTAIMIFVVEEPKAKGEIITLLKELKSHIQLNAITTVDFYSLVYEALETVNEKYKKIAIILTPQIKSVLGDPVFKTPQLLERCAIDRLVFWIDQNLRNLEML